MPFEGTKILEFNQYKKSDKPPFIIYADLQCVIGKTDKCKNNPENWSEIKISKYIPSGFSMSTISSLRSAENKHDVYRGKDCMKKFCEFLREDAMETINSKKKKWSFNKSINKRILTKEQQESYENSKICYICKKKIERKLFER